MGMMRYNRTNATAVAKLMTHPLVIEWTQDERVPFNHMVKVWEKTLSLPMMYGLGRDPAKELFLFAPIQWTMYTAHVALHPDNRGQDALDAMREAAGWLFDNTPCKTLISFVAADHKACRTFVAMCGMTEVGRTEKTFLRNGEMIDEVIYQGTEEKYRRT